MIKGYLGDVCFNGKLHRNHIVNINSNGRVTNITPFTNESEGIILCDDIIIIVSADVIISSLIIHELRECLENSNSISEFLKSETYIKYNTNCFVNSQLVFL